MKIYNNILQNTEEWLKLRLGKFTASDAQAIGTNGKGLETLCFVKVAEIKTGKIAESYKNENMERGNELEEMARTAYELESGIVVQQIGFVEKSEFVGCSPDGLVNADGLMEIKCPTDATFVRYLYDGRIDPAYVWQMQMQMLVCERNWCDYVIFNPNFEPTVEIVRIDRDEDKIEKIRMGLEDGEETVKRILEKI